MTHYLRTFEHLAPQEKVAPPHRRRRRTWLALPILALLGLTWTLRSGDQPKAPEDATKRPNAPRIAAAPSQPQQTQPAEAVPPVRVVERSGPKLIEKMLAEKFGTELPKQPAPPPRRPEPPPQVALAKPAPPPPPPAIMDRPDPAEMPRIAEPAVVPAPQPEPPMVVAAKPATPPAPPQIADRPALAELRLAEKAKAEKEKAEKEKAKKEEMVARAPARLTAPLTTPRDDEPTPANTSKRDAQAAERVEDDEMPAAATTREAPTPARVEERPVVAQQAERVRPVEAERVAAADTAVIEKPVVTERPVAVIERVVATPAVAVATHGGTAPVEAERVAVVRTTGTRSSGPTDDAVRSLLDRYAAAWRGHDVDTLRAIGQVTNDGQAAALRQYFADVGDLEVEVRVLDIRTDGDRATVRFTRRDTFRDPTGREVAKESPPIEKIVVMTPQGLRFVPAS